MNDKKYYVYTLTDPINNEIFYVGKGTKNRMYKHEVLVKRHKLPNGNNYYLYKIIKEIINRTSNNKIIYEKVFQNDDSDICYEYEAKTIKNIGLDKLTNLCDGGIVPILSGIKNGMYGKKHSKETKRKMRNKRTTTINMKKSEETKKKIGDWHRGKKISIEQREQISKTLTGRKLSDETKLKIKNSLKNSIKFKEIMENSIRNEKIRQSKIGTKLSDETKEKIRQSKLGTTVSKETKTKLSIANGGSNNPNYNNNIDVANIIKLYNEGNTINKIHKITGYCRKSIKLRLTSEKS